MRKQKLFDSVHKNINKFETRLDKYVIPSTITTEKIQLFSCKKSQADNINLSFHEKPELTPKKLQQNCEKYAAFSSKNVHDDAKICTWIYMNQNEIVNLLQISRKSEIRKTIGNRMGIEYPKGISRLLVIELMYSALQFCKKSNFNIEQIGSLLSIFYLTHQYFLSEFYTAPEKAFIYFKKYLALHCLECSPDSVLLFNYSESKFIALYFCKVYLNNLSLLRLLTLPNFAFRFHFGKVLTNSLEEKKVKNKSK